MPVAERPGSLRGRPDSACGRPGPGLQSPDPMTDTPATLLDRLRRPGDSAAWAQFVHLYTPLLYRWAGRLGLGPAEAADLVQDVFVALLKALPTFRYDGRRSFRAWLCTLVRNRYRDARRK